MKRHYIKLKSVLAMMLMCFSITFLNAQGGIVADPVAGCDGADGTLALSDPDPITYDIDLYLWDPAAGAVVGGPVNMYNFNSTPSITVDQDEPMGCDCEDSPAVDLYWVEWQDPFTAPADGTLITAGLTTISCPLLTETIIAPDCTGTVPSVEITSPDGTVCFSMDGTAGEDPAATCPTDPVDGALSYSFTAFPGTDCEAVFTNDLAEVCSCECPMDLGTYVDPMEVICGAGLPSMLPTLADLVDAPGGASLTWDIDPAVVEADASGLDCGMTDVVVYTGTVTCLLDASVIATITYTLTDECPQVGCGGDLCDLGVITTIDPVEVCAGGTAAVVVGALSGTDPAYDVDVYIVGSDGSSAGPVNVFTATNQTLTATPEAVQGCDPVDVSYTAYVVCWQDAFDPADPLATSLVDFDAGTVTVYPELTETVVAPDCMGTLPSVEITSPDGTVCFSFEGTPGEDPAATCPTDPVDGSLVYDETFFAGTACEVNFAMDLTEVCTCSCPEDLGTYMDPMEVLCAGPGAPSMLPVLADLVDAPSGAALAWDIDPTLDVDPQGCDAETVVYTGTVTCLLDDAVIVEVIYTFTVYPVLTVTETAPDCDAEAGLVEITSPDGTVCFTMAGTVGVDGDCDTAVDGELAYSFTAFAGTECETVFENTIVTSCGIVDCGGPICDIAILTTDLSGCPGDVITLEVGDINGVDPSYDVDVYLYEGTTQIADVGNLFTASSITEDLTVGCDPIDYTLEVVCWQDPVGDPGTNLLSIPFTLDVDATCVDPTPEFVSGPSDATPGCVDDDCTPLSGNTITFECPAGYEAYFSAPVNATYSGFVDNGDGTYSVDILPICNQGDGFVAITVDCICGDGVGGSTLKELTDLVRTPVDYDCPFGYGVGCMPEPLLPIELVSFTAVKEGAFNRINWVTASEINNQFQIIEKSANGVDGWNEINRQDGHAFSLELNEYTFLDRFPMTESYYRLKAVDYDGFTEYSDVIVVRRDNDIIDFALTASPNPFSNITQIAIHSDFEDGATVTVTDVTGKVVMVKNISVALGVNYLEIDGSNFDTGIYFVNLSSALRQSTLKLIKQ